MTIPRQFSRVSSEDFLVRLKYDDITVVIRLIVYKCMINMCGTVVAQLLKSSVMRRSICIESEVVTSCLGITLS